MRTRLSTSVVGAFLAVAALAAAAAAQIPGIPSGPRFSVAELRGLADVPRSAESGFKVAAAGTAFPGEVHTLIAKFQASGLPSDAGLEVVWIRGKRGSAGAVVSASPTNADALAAGVYTMLTNNGAALAPGDYQVAVRGTGGKVYRVIDVIVLEPKPPSKRPAASSAPLPPASGATPGAPAGKLDSTDPEPFDAPMLDYTLENIGWRYSSRYSAVSLPSAEHTGVLFGGERLPGFLFVVMKKNGRFDFDKEIDDVRLNLLRLRSSSSDFAGWKDYSLDAIKIGGTATRGRLFVAHSNGLRIQISMYLANIGGRSVITGFGSITSEGFANPAIQKGIPTTNGTADDFFQMVRSLKPVAAEKQTADPTPRRKSTDPIATLSRVPFKAKPSVLF
jgi:hypothetical protein